MGKLVHDAAGDVRLRGFGDRALLQTAFTWLDARVSPAAAEIVSLAAATSRVLTTAIDIHADLPDTDRAAANGYAVRAADCDGASAYNPLALAWHEPGTAMLPPNSATSVATGWALPSGADAVLPFEAAERSCAHGLEVLAAVAHGTGIHRPGDMARAGSAVLAGGQRLLPQDVACLAALGHESVSVVPRVHVRLIVPGPKSGPDTLTPLLLALLQRDGALAELVPETALAAALPDDGCGLVLIAGRGGIGPDDSSAAAIRTAGGALALHGLALHPGGSAGLGEVAGTPVILLPGDPFACLTAYDLLAGRLVRRLAGAGVALPYASAKLVLGRKIVSGIGLTEIVPVRVTGQRAHPVSAEAGLDALLADGFVVIPQGSEGHPSGATVSVHLYRGVVSIP